MILKTDCTVVLFIRIKLEQSVYLLPTCSSAPAPAPAPDPDPDPAPAPAPATAPASAPAPIIMTTLDRHQRIQKEIV